MLSGKQIKMARAGIDWSVHVLAEKAGTTANTVSRIERGGEALASTLDKIQKALEAAGVKFIDDGSASQDGGPGVRLREK